MPVGDRSVGHRRRDQRKLRWRWLTGQGAAWSQLRGQPHPSRGLPSPDPQPLGQQHRRRRTAQLGRDSPRLHLGHQGKPDRGPLPNVNLQRSHQLQQLITTQRGRINGAQRLPRRRQLSQRGPHR